MADYSVTSINLAAVKQYDPCAKEILDRASQVALYTFNGDKNEWKKTEVEGALFVYSRNAEPHHNIIIMNRLNTFNLVEPVVQGLDIQEHAPFLLYRNNRLDIFGIWFYEKSECERIARVLDTLVKDWDKRKNDKHPSKKDSDKQPSSKVINACANINNNSVDICSMLSRAQEEYNSGKSPQIPNDSVPTETPQSVMDFFAKASSSSNLNKEKPPAVQPPGLFVGKHPGHPGHPGQRVPPPETNDASIRPLMQRLMSNPVHSVEHIEKQQRSVTPQQNDLVSTPDKVVPKEVKPRTPGAVLLDHRQDSVQKPELMPPVMFSSSLSNLPTTPKSLPKGAPNPVCIVQALSESLPEVQLRPMVGPQSPLPKPEPLTKNQLLQAFSYLLKNDPDFINSLHAAYVKSFAEIVP